jgi:N-acyl homoserine lactone hydrolase
LKSISSPFLRIKSSIIGVALLVGIATLLQSEAARASSDSKDPLIRALPDNGVKLYTMDCGRVEMSDTDFLADDGSLKGLPGKSVVPCFLIRHAQGDLIWDTGLPDKTKENVPKPDAAFRFELKQTLTEQLQTIGLAPSDIKFVSFSHLHFDHAGNGNAFASATCATES